MVPDERSNEKMGSVFGLRTAMFTHSGKVGRVRNSSDSNSIFNRMAKKINPGDQQLSKHDHLSIEFVNI